jgi:uncharacterized membrane protein
MDKMVTFSYAKYLKESLLGSFWLGSPRTQKSYYLYKLFLTVLQNVWRNKNIFKQKDTPFKEFKKRVVDNNIYALMSAGTVSIKIVFL